MATKKDYEDLIIRVDQRTLDIVDQLKTLNGSVANTKRRVGTLERNFWALIGVLVGSGVLTGTVYFIDKLFA